MGLSQLQSKCFGINGSRSCPQSEHEKCYPAFSPNLLSWAGSSKDKELLSLASGAYHSSLLQNILLSFTSLSACFLLVNCPGSTLALPVSGTIGFGNVSFRFLQELNCLYSPRNFMLGGKQDHVQKGCQC